MFRKGFLIIVKLFVKINCKKNNNIYNKVYRVKLNKDVYLKQCHPVMPKRS